MTGTQLGLGLEQANLMAAAAAVAVVVLAAADQE
jgi:hypothetical protein